MCEVVGVLAVLFGFLLLIWSLMYTAYVLGDALRILIKNA